MPQFKVAHIRAQGNDMIIVPLTRNFENKSSGEQSAFIAELQFRANSAGLRGTVAVVWDGGIGCMKFICPTQWQPFFSSMNLAFVWANATREISW